MGARLILLGMCLIGYQSVNAQNLEEGQRNGLLQATASFYPSWMLNHKVQNNYIGGHFAYYFEDHYSFRGEIMAYIDAQGDQKYVDKHVQVQAGFGRHFPIKRWDPFVYGQMGLSAVQLKNYSDAHLQPTIGLIVGVHYNVSRFFYFFAEGQYNHTNDPERKGPMDQIYVSGGLGFQLPTKH